MPFRRKPDRSGAVCDFERVAAEFVIPIAALRRLRSPESRPKPVFGLRFALLHPGEPTKRHGGNDVEYAAFMSQNRWKDACASGEVPSRIGSRGTVSRRKNALRRADTIDAVARDR